MYNFLDLACEEFHGHGLTIIYDWMVWCKTCRLQVRSAWVGGEQELEPDDILVGGNVISRSDKIWEHRRPARSVDRVYFESDRYPRMESRQPCPKFISALSMSLLFCMAPREADSRRLVHDIIIAQRHHPLNTIFAGTPACIHEATASASYRQYGMVAHERHSGVASSSVGRVLRSALACAPCPYNTVLVCVSALHKLDNQPTFARPSHSPTQQCDRLCSHTQPWYHVRAQFQSVWDL
jgi:hypothetical protein